MNRPHTPNRIKRRTTVLLRGLLTVVVGGLLIEAGPETAGLGALALILAFAVSDLLLCFLPLRFVATVRFELLVGALDLLLVGLGVELAGTGGGALPVTCLLMVLVVALAGERSHAVAGAAVVGALHAWLVLRTGAAGMERQLVLQVLFVSAVGLYYAFLAEGLHRLRKRRDAEELERRELGTLLEVLDAITSSLDLPRVTHAIVSRATSIVPAVRCSVLHVDPSRGRCLVLASSDMPDFEPVEIDLAKYPEVRRSIETREPVIVQDVSSDPLMAEVRRHLRTLDFHSIIVIPLTFGQDVLGTLCLKTARAGQPFSSSEIKLCTAMARAAANALKNALLHLQVLEESRLRRATGEKLARVLHDSPDLILTTDREGRVTELNREASRLTGIAREEALGRPCEHLLGLGANPGLLEKVRADGTVPTFSSRIRRRDGSEVEMDLRTSALRDDAGAVTGTVWIGRDVTDLRAAQLQLLQAEKLSTIGRVVAGVAHELNNPLTGVLGYSQLLLAREGDGSRGRELERIHASALRCQRIVEDLLAFARAHKPERRYVGINAIVERTLDLKRYNLEVNDVEVVSELCPDLPCTMLDGQQIQQVLLNLLGNAQQSIAAARRRPGRIVVRTSLADGAIRVEISDTGEGMETETLSRIFDPFFTTKAQGEGTGLGLSVSYGIVKEHGGTIYARSQRGVGSTFVVELPVWREEGAEPEAMEAPRAARAPGGEGGRILVVDDEPMIVDLLTDVLAGAGHQVDGAADGSEACRMASSGAYDLVITDVRMPRMNGMDLYRNLLSVRPEMARRVLFMTGDLMDREVARFLTETGAPTLYKPLDIGRIETAVQEMLAGVES